ncbi:MAG TPA: EamA family transporter, partial [Candidatus Dormibacteraeota bacterium]|nr:EamA family transporter [Candidatus Dormibacteraeota bacterium]
TDPQDLRGSLRKHAFRLEGLTEVIMAMIGYSFWLLYLDKFLNGKQWLFYLLIIRSIAVLTLGAYAAAKRTSLRFKDTGLWKFLVCIGVFDVAAYSFVSYGFSHSRYPSVIVVLSATFSLPTMLLAYLFLKEKIKPFQLAAALTILCGVVLITLS